MNIQSAIIRTRRTLFAVASATVLLSVVVNPAPAQADPNASWPIACRSDQVIENGKWQWIVNFDNGVASSCLVQKSLNGQASFSQSRCATIGNVPITGGRATFDGVGYLRCKMNPPGNGNANLPEFDMMASAQVTGIAFASTGNPIFVHPNAKLFLPQPSNTSGVQISSVMNGVTRTGFAGMPGLGMTNYRASFAQGTRNHSVNYVLASQWSDVAGSVGLNVNAKDVFIGYDPVSGNKFSGVLDFVWVDPQTRTDCC